MNEFVSERQYLVLLLTFCLKKVSQGFLREYFTFKKICRASCSCFVRLQVH